MTFRLLFADDSPTMHRVVQITVAQEQIELLLARSGREALAQSHKNIPDAALIDVHMPEMDGYALCEQLKRDPRTAHVPVVLLFSSQHPLDEARAQAVGADGSIAKPFESQALLEKLAQVRGLAEGSHDARLGGVRAGDAHAQALAPIPSDTAGLSASYAAVPPSPAARVPLAAAGERPSFFGSATPQAAPSAAPSHAHAQTHAQHPAMDGGAPSVHAILGTPIHKEAHTPFVAPPNEDITLVGARPVLAPREQSTSRVVQLDAHPFGTPPPQRLTAQPSGPASGAASSWLQDNAAPQAAQTGPLPSREALSSATLSGLPELPSWDAPYAPPALPLLGADTAAVPSVPGAPAPGAPYSSSHAAISSALSNEQRQFQGQAVPLAAQSPAEHAQPADHGIEALVREEVRRQLPHAVAAYFAALTPEQREGLMGVHAR